MPTLVDSLYRHSWRRRLGVPEDRALDRAGTRAVLDEFPVGPPFDDALWAEIRRLAVDVVLERSGWQSAQGCLEVDGARVFVDRYLGGRLAVRCDRCDASARCPHLPAFLIAVAHGDEALRPRLSQPPWRHFLTPVLEGSPRRTHQRPRPGWLKAVLHTEPSDAPDAILDKRLTVWLMHRSKDGKRVLKPRQLPRLLAELDLQASGLTPGERALVGRIDDLRTLSSARSSYGTTHDPNFGLNATKDRCRGDIVALLADVTELCLDDTPIAFDPAPWRPRLLARDAPDGGLALAWASSPRLILPAGPRHVVVDDRLRPVDPSVPADALARSAEPPPSIPPSDVGLFVDLVAAASTREQPSVELPASSLPVEYHPPTPRLHLGADGETLSVELRFGYGSTECGPDDPDLLYDTFAEAPRLIRRDPEAERALWRRLADLTGCPSEQPTRLTFTGEAAFGFLGRTVDALADFELVTDDTLDLRRWRPSGPLEVCARVDIDPDWFDLRVYFGCAGQRVAADDVLESWRAGRRYLRLGDGRIARLPDVWLAQHGATLGELHALRDRRRRVAPFAAPMVVDLLDHIEVDAADRAAGEQLRALAGRIRDFDGVPDRPLPSGLRATLRDYQHRGYRWMCALADLGLSCVLADDMGLGKTVQVLTVLLDAHHADPAGPPSLVVAPTSVIHNWVLEARRFAPDLRVALHHGPDRGAPPTDVDVVITNYALLRIDIEPLGAIDWRYAVLDEAQYIKNPASQTARAARALRARHRLALSGTPFENHLLELWSLFEFVMPGFFGSRQGFRQRYVEPIQQTADVAAHEEALDRLRRRIRPFVLRRLKREVAAELPPRQEQILWCDLSHAERRLYEAVKETYRSTVLERVDDVGVARATIVILEALTRLRQAACDVALLPFPEARAVRHSAKRRRLVEALEALSEAGHRALVFSQWSTLLQRVRADLDGAGLTHLYLDGRTTERADLQARWNAPDGPPVFLISLKAGGTGLNLVGADVVIHLDPWWNPQAEQQATDRAHRIGQTRPVMVYRMVARDTVEEKVLELQDRKRALFEATIDGDRATVDALTRADLEAVFGDGSAGPRPG